MALKLSKSYNLNKIMEADNAATLIAAEDLDNIGRQVVDDYVMDKATRSDWEEQYKDATKLALQILERKTTPWEGASNVKFPLLTVAALQFHSRAYPALVTYPDLVKCRVIGDDPQGLKYAHAERVSTFMSYQLLELDENWQEDTDRLFLMLPIVGCIIRKTYYDSVRGQNCSETILPEDFVVAYSTRNLRQCPRCTHVLHMSLREIKNKQIQNKYLKKVNISEWSPDNTDQGPSEEIKQERGYTPPSDDDSEKDRDILEQHRYIDLDGDGFAEPYICTVDKGSYKVLRLIARFSSDDIIYDHDNEIAQLKSQAVQLISSPSQAQNAQQAQFEQAQKQQQIEAIKGQIQELESTKELIDIKPIEYFTKHTFIPSVDGGFYDLGFGALLGPVNHAINTAINQIFDAGTLSNSNVGFIGSNAHILGNDYRFRPFEWKRAEMVGADLKSALVPLPINPPSPVIYQLLELLINYAERVSSVTDLMVGETPGQNTPATTSMNALNEGQKVFSGIMKRLYRSMTQEYRKLYSLNRLYLNPQEYFTVLGTNQNTQVYQQDFLGNPNEVCPEADPAMGSDSQRMQQASFLATRSKEVPGYDPQQVEIRLLKAMHISDPEDLYNLKKFPPQPTPDMQEVQLKMADQQRKAAETKASIQNDTVRVLSEVEQAKAQTILFLAQAKKLGVDAQIQMLEKQLDVFSFQAEHLRGLIEAGQNQQEIENDRELREQELAASKQQSPAGPAS